MASPLHPLTPPADPSPHQPQATQATQSSTQQPQSSQPANSSTQVEALLLQPRTSLSDDGSQKRPRDQRLIHLLLAAHGVAAYQERVPLQLMDFAYRYTSSVLSDALHIQAEGYEQAGPGAGGSGSVGADGQAGAAAAPASKGRAKILKPGAGADEGDVSMAALRMAIGSRMSYQFQGALPKEFLKGLAEERNRVSLGVGLASTKADAPATTTIGGVRLPHEKHCLTGVAWGLKQEWDSEGEEEVDGVRDDAAGARMLVDGEGDEYGDGDMDDIFGPDRQDEEMNDA